MPHHKQDGRTHDLSKEKISQPTITNLDGTPWLPPPLSKSFNRSHYLLEATIQNSFRRYPLQQALFVTLTFDSDERSTRKAHQHLNSLLNKVRRRCLGYIWVLEPQISGRIHYHILLFVSFDAHSGTNLDAWKDRDLHSDDDRCRSMNTALRGESDWWQYTVPRYGFGRTEVAPIYSNADAIRKYLLKQDWRVCHWPFKEKRGLHFWSCSNSVRIGNLKFSWVSPGARLRRGRLAAWAQLQGCHSYEDLRPELGPKWGYQFLQSLLEAEQYSDAVDCGIPVACTEYLIFLATVFPNSFLAAKLRMHFGVNP